MTVEVKAGKHTLIADEPSDYGGNDEGPNPYSLLLAALGACTVMTIAGYAERHNLVLDKVEVEVSYRRILAEDCKDSDQAPKYTDRITKKIKIKGNLSPEQKDRIYKISTRCPVHRLLLAKPDITSELQLET